MKHLLLLAVLLLPALVMGAEGDGRYQLVPSKDGNFMVDTRTGRTWFLLPSKSDVFFVPTKYQEEETFKMSETPPADKITSSRPSIQDSPKHQ